MIRRVVTIARVAIDEVEAPLEAANICGQEGTEIVTKVAVYKMKVPCLDIDILRIAVIRLDIDAESRRMMTVSSRAPPATVE